jgi:hypothetical protein
VPLRKSDRPGFAVGGLASCKSSSAKSRGERFCAPIDACSNTDSAVTRFSAACSPIGAFRAASYGVGAFQGSSAVRAAWTREGGRCYSLTSRFSRFVLDAPSPQARLSSDPEPRDCFLARRRLSAPWMLTLRTPSFHIGAGRAFTENDPTSDALCRSTAPAVGSCSDRQLLPHMPLSSMRGQVHRESQNRPTVPSLEEPSPLTRRWRNDSRRLPSCRLPCEPPLIRAAFQPHGPDALRRLAEPRTMPPL